MDKRSLLAIVLSVLILIAYQELVSYFYPPPKRPDLQQQAESLSPPPTPPVSETPSEREGQKRPAGVSSASGEAPPVEAREITVENDVYKAVFVSLGGRLRSLELKH